MFAGGAGGAGGAGTEMMVSDRLFLRKKMRCMTRAVRAEKFTAAWYGRSGAVERAEDRFQKNGEIAVSRGTGKTEFCAAGKFDRTSLPDYIINGLREVE